MPLSWKINNLETQEKGTLGVKIQKIPNEACRMDPRIGLHLWC